jgi:hypothetical protein
MAHIDPLLERNKHFATTAARAGTSIVAKYPVYVITCLDPRTDPSAFLPPLPRGQHRPENCGATIKAAERIPRAAASACSKYLSESRSAPCTTTSRRSVPALGVPREREAWQGNRPSPSLLRTGRY